VNKEIAMKIPVYILVIFLLFAGLLAGFFLLFCNDRAGHVSHYYLPVSSFPKDSVIIEFGNTNQTGSSTSGIPFDYSRFLDETKSDIEPWYFPSGPIIGYGYGIEGKLVVMHYYDWHVNRTMIDEIYSRLAAKGKAYGFESIPCVFVSSDIPDARCAVETLPPGSPHWEILLQSFGLNSSILGYPVY
jgi:hypothetical protein